jgi:hypothetical protein
MTLLSGSRRTCHPGRSATARRAGTHGDYVPAAYFAPRSQIFRCVKFRDDTAEDLR